MTPSRLSELSSRWSQVQIDLVVNAIRGDCAFSDLPFLERHEGRWDLRGLPLAGKARWTSRGIGGKEATSAARAITFKRVDLKQVDLSCAEFGGSSWESCGFEDVRFEHARGNSLQTWVCEFRRVSFREADLRGSALGGSIGSKANVFSEVDFSGADLRDTSYMFPLFRDCDFSNAVLDEVDFNGSRFERCRFAGVLDSVVFNGHCTVVPPSTLWGRAPNYSGIRNSMTDVDFSLAVFRGVAFRFGIDLRSCKLPQDGDHLVISDPGRFWARIRDRIEREWQGDDRRIALALIDSVYSGETKVGMPMDVVDRAMLVSELGTEFAERFFSALQSWG